MILRTYCCSNKLKTRLHNDPNQDEEDDDQEAAVGQKKVSPSLL
jgi:hypothetical protein